MEDMITPIIFMLVIGGVSGYLAGNLVKKASGMALTIAIFAFVVIGLAYTGNLDLNLDALTSNISHVIGIIAPLGIMALLSSVPFVASFVAGLFVGFRRQ